MKKYIIVILVTISVVIFDQVSKFYASTLYAEHGVVSFLNFCSFVQFWNKGISFGMFHNMENGNGIFMLISAAMMSVLILMLIKTHCTRKAACISMILGGSIGNFSDRLMFGAVYDFIYLRVGEFYWPAFNVADASIVLGVITFLVLETRVYIRQDSRNDYP